MFIDWEKRRVRRKEAQFPVTVRSFGDPPAGEEVLTTRNVSRLGIFVETKSPLPHGRVVRVHGRTPTGVVISCDGLVWRSLATGMAIMFSVPCEAMDSV